MKGPCVSLGLYPLSPSSFSLRCGEETSGGRLHTSDICFLEIYWGAHGSSAEIPVGGKLLHKCTFSPLLNEDRRAERRLNKDVCLQLLTGLCLNSLHPQGPAPALGLRPWKKHLHASQRIWCPVLE